MSQSHTQTPRRHGRKTKKSRSQGDQAPVRPGLLGGAYQPLTTRDLERIHETTLDVLENFGMAEPIDSCRELIVSHGGRINEQGRLCFPRALVEDIIAKAGRNFVLHGRDAVYDLDLTGNKVYFSGSTAAVNMLDIDSGRYRESTLADVYDIARVEDSLPNMHFVHRPCIARDMPNAALLDLNTAYALMSATSKHFITSFFEPNHLLDTVEMIELSLGSQGAFRKRPICTIVCAFVVSPLRFAADSCRTLEAAVQSGMPVWLASAVQAGSTGPTALAGTLVQINAENLAGLVYANLICPGHPVIMGNWTFVSDLRSGATCGGGEMAVMMAAAAQLSHYYDLPVTVGAGLADSKIPDAQAGWERGYSTAMAGLAGANIIVGAAGGQAQLMGFSLESLLIDHDMLGAVLRGIRGIEVNDETLSYDVIGEVVNGAGHFLGHPQTLQRMSSDYVYPELGNRDSIDEWEEKGSPDIRSTAKTRLREILAAHFPKHIDAGIDRRIRERFDIRLPIERMGALAAES